MESMPLKYNTVVANNHPKNHIFPASCIYYNGFDATQSSINVKDVGCVNLTNSTDHTTELEQIIVTQQNAIIKLNDAIRVLTEKIEGLESIFSKSKNVEAESNMTIPKNIQEKNVRTAVS
ncbi:hypothetical protein GJ496_010411 [Pomphorhynchus laevis]|nr:hypothetical protein GJ496_010411 [Pomphorhynchus laevis]